MIFDLHVHTTYSSCSRLGIEEILQHARDKGLDGVCITDHNTMDIQGDIIEGMQDDGLLVIFGMEYDTPDGDFLVFGPFEDLSPGLPAEDLLHIVAERGGVAVAAHPFRFDRPVAQNIVQKGLCPAVESINGRNSDLENARVQAWTKKYPLIQCGGSDAHTIEELGSVVTSIDASVSTRDDLIHAIKSGLCTPSFNTRAACSTRALELSDQLADKKHFRILTALSEKPDCLQGIWKDINFLEDFHEKRFYILRKLFFSNLDKQKEVIIFN